MLSKSEDTQMAQIRTTTIIMKLDGNSYIVLAMISIELKKKES